MSERIRTTISLDPAVHEIFKTMAETAGVSVSRCMGDWLADTAEGAQFVAHKMQEARKAPQQVMREMHQMAKGMTSDIEQTIAHLKGREEASGGKRTRASGRLPASPAPSSNTGLNSPKRSTK